MIRRDRTLYDAAQLVYWAVEMFGSFVYERVVDLHTLDRMHGGWIRECWKRLRVWIESERVDARNSNIGEWFEWLNIRLQSDPDPGKAAGAHVAYRDKTGR